MPNWKSQLRGDPTEWLLEEGNASVRYFTLRWLFDRPAAHPEAEAASQAIARSEPVQRILQRQRPEGYWGSDSRPHHGTRGRLNLLMWLGYRGNGAVRKAMDYRLNGCISGNGGYGIQIKDRRVYLPCHGADLLRLMLWFGYENDPRARRLLDWLLSVQEPEGTWPCISKRRPFSCFWATAGVLRAYRDLPPDWINPEIQDSRRRTVDLFLSSGLYNSPSDRGKPSPRWFQFGFPLQWDTDVLEVLELVAPYVEADDGRIQEGLCMVLDKQDADGRWPCEKPPKGGKWMMKLGALEEVGAPSKWVTLHAMRLLRALYGE